MLLAAPPKRDGAAVVDASRLLSAELLNTARDVDADLRQMQAAAASYLDTGTVTIRAFLRTRRVESAGRSCCSRPRSFYSSSP
jgi:hypothetical protein